MRRVLLLAFLAAACMSDAEANPRTFGYGFRAGQRAGAAPSAALGIHDIQGVELYATAANTDVLWVEADGTSPAITRVASAGDVVGRWDSRTNDAFVGHGTGTSRPTYRTGPARLEFDGSDDVIAFPNTASALACVHNSGVFTIAVKFAVRSDAGDVVILDNSSWTSASFGFTVVRRSATDDLDLDVYRAVAGEIFDVNTTATIGVAGERYCLEWRGNNASGTDVRISAMAADGTCTTPGTLETYARESALVAAADASFQLQLARENGTADGEEVDILDLMITCTYADDASLTIWRGCDTDCMAESVAPRARAGAPFYTGLWRYYDTGNTATMWQDTARTVPANDDGELVRHIDHAFDSDRNLTRGATAPSDTERPSYTAATGSLNFAYTGDYVAAGDYDALIIDNNSGIDPFRGGAMTIAMVIRNTTSDPAGEGQGHHYLDGTSGTTDTIYASATACDHSLDAAGSWHMTPGTTDILAAFSPCAGSPWPEPILVFLIRDGDDISVFWHSASGITSTGPETPITNTIFAMHSIGSNDLDNPWEGRIGPFAQWNFAMTSAQRAVIAAAWGF